MNVLIVNKFLYPNGGSETYIFKLGEQLEKAGHRVEYFGMEHPDNCVGNSASAYTEQMDFHNSGALKKIKLSLKTIYSKEARQKIRLVLDSFKPDVVHINNFNFQLTPSIIVEIRKWEKEEKHKVKIILTAHDYQLVCPNHMMYRSGEICEACIGGRFVNCTKGRCIHDSLLKSAIGTAEAMYWNGRSIYSELDTVICCSEFLRNKLTTNPVFRDKAIALHNFVDRKESGDTAKEDYVLYFGRLCKEKGIETILSCKNIKFIVAGTGPLEEEVRNADNIEYVGFKTGDELTQLIAKARVTVAPSIVYENCPLSVMESIVLGTPVIGAKIGGIPELISDGETGFLFEAGNAQQFEAAIKELTENEDKAEAMSKACLKSDFFTAEEYCERLLDIYNN